MGPEHVPAVANLACRMALSRRSVAHINFPIDFQSMPCKKARPSERGKHLQTTQTFARSAALPSDHDVQRAAAVLNAGKRIAILAGAGALEATDELLAASEKLSKWPIPTASAWPLSGTAASRCSWPTSSPP